MRLDLHFESPMQSWGTTELWYKTRRTESCPTKTAVTGIIGRSMGIDWEDTDELEKIANSFTIVSSENTVIPMPKRMQDDQTIYIGDYMDAGIVKGFRTGANGIKNVNGAVRAQQMTKDYLEDEKITITIEGNREDLEEIRNALLHPVWPPYLGRACCIPSGQIIRGDVY